MKPKWTCRLLGHSFRYSRPFFYCQRCGFHFHNPYVAPGAKVTDLVDRADRIVGQISDGTSVILPSKESTLTSQRDLITSIDGHVDVGLGTRAAEVTLTDARDSLTSIDGKVGTRATETTLTDARDNLTSIDGKVGTRATEATLTDAQGSLTSIEGKVATESTVGTLVGETPAATTHEATAADTESSFDLPVGTRRFTIKARGGRMDIGFVTGERPIQIADGGSYWEDMLDLPGALTVYYSSPTAGAIAEVLYWT